MNLQQQLERYDVCERIYPDMKDDWDLLRRKAIKARRDELWERHRGMTLCEADLIELGTLRAKLERAGG